MYFRSISTASNVHDHLLDSNPIPQKLTLLGGWPYLKCLHGKKLALPGGLVYEADR